MATIGSMARAKLLEESEQAWIDDLVESWPGISGIRIDDHRGTSAESLTEKLQAAGVGDDDVDLLVELADEIIGLMRPDDLPQNRGPLRLMTASESVASILGEAYQKRKALVRRIMAVTGKPEAAVDEFVGATYYSDRTAERMDAIAAFLGGSK